MFLGNEKAWHYIKIHMADELFETAKENDLSLEEAEEPQEFKDETGLGG
jgi:hypothetical protein